MPQIIIVTNGGVPRPGSSNRSETDIALILNMEQDPRVIRFIRRGGAGRPDSDGVTVVICTYRRPKNLPGVLNSLFIQSSRARAVIIVDASPDTESEDVVANLPLPENSAMEMLYVRVAPQLKGLTLQRNFGLEQVGTPLVVYFDDDVVLSPGCLSELERAFENDHSIVGAAGYNNAYRPSRRLWNLRKALGIVTDLRPGSYQRSGMSVPWSFMSPSEVLVSDWLPGCGMMWKTAVLRSVGGFNEGFSNYALGEDLDMSLRAGREGKLVVVGPAKFDHLLEKGGGRPDEFRQGYMEIHNRFLIQRRCLADRTWRDTIRFAYAWTMDSIMLLRRLSSHRSAVPALQQLSGRLAGALDLLRGR